MVAKRKRDNAAEAESVDKSTATKKTKQPSSTAASTTKTAHHQTAPFKLSSYEGRPPTIQIIAGSYDRVLHGVTATIDLPAAPAPKPTKSKKSKTDAAADAANDGAASKPAASFADTFLFNAHASSIRCLALSPPSLPTKQQPSQKILLATGATDERINIYNLSAHPPSARTADGQRLLSAVTPRPVLENPKNRELGTLLHHSSNITRLVFPNRSKLLSAAEDSTIAVSRTRDWAVLHSFKCPIPKAQGRPSGDTAGLNGAPSGVNDFAVHPSNKIMISVSKGERCMRLWNLETGKKSRVLNFDKGNLIEIGETRHSTGEARRIIWGTSKGGEDEFAVAFDRDVLVFGMDCRPRCRLMRDVPGPKTKVHQIRYVNIGGEEDSETVLAVSTEDGRVLFFSTDKDTLVPAKEKEAEKEEAEPKKKSKVPSSPALACARFVGQLGGKDAGVTGRIKDFTVLPVEDEQGERSWFVVTGSSDGRLRVWRVGGKELTAEKGREGKQMGQLLGTYETQNRITCVEAFVMIPRPDGAEESEFEFDSESGSDDDEDDSE